MEGPDCEKLKTEEGGCKRQGVGGKEPGQELGFWRLGGLGPVWATLSRLKTFIFLLQIKFGN